MSHQALVRTRARGIAVALAGVLFCDFIGVMLLSLGPFGWILGLGAMFVGSFYAAWMALEAHPRRRTLTLLIGIVNAVILVVLAILLVLALYGLSQAQWG